MESTISKAKSTERIKGFFVLAVLSIVWGSSFILIKRGLVVYSPDQVATLRLAISAIAFLPFFLFRFRKIDWSKWKALLVVGLTGSGLPAFLFSFAQTKISSSVAGILNSLTPLFTFFLGVLLFGSAFQWSRLGGVLLGLIGAILLILYGNDSGFEGDFWYSMLVILAALCYGTSVNTVGTYLKEMNSITISAAAFLLIGTPALVYLFSTDFVTRLTTVPEAWEALGYVAILSLAGTVLASIIFFQLVHWTNAVFASTVAYVIPIVALGWGLLDGESITVFHLLGMVFILAGVYMSRKKR
ncbi:MAG: permease [Saprospiraceae bacterium]|nr:MAG: permease [Saprospiraceae bacterium]